MTKIIELMTPEIEIEIRNLSLYIK